MRVLLIGGTGLSGPFIARELLRRNDEVIIFHRGEHESSFLPECEHIHGDRRDREQFEKDLRNIEADAVIDMYSMIDADSEPVIRAFRGRIQACWRRPAETGAGQRGGPRRTGGLYD